MRARAATAVRPVLLVAFLAVACAGDSAPGEGGLEWGIDGPADAVGCDPAAELCWPAEDADAMRRYLAAQQALLLDEGEPAAAATALVASLEALSHKLGPDEVAVVAALSAEARSLGPEPTDEERLGLLAAAHEGAGERLVSGYLTAHAVPVGRAALEGDDGEGAADGFSGGGSAAAGTGLPAGVRESLELLRQAGALGHVYAFLLERTGVLEDLPEPEDEAEAWELTREERVDRIVRRANWATAGWSTVAAAESLVPYAGFVISISHEMLMHFRLRARMVFQIAAAHGLDLRDDLNLFMAATAMMSAYHLPEIQGLWASSMALTGLTAAAERVALRALLLRALQPMLAAMTARGAEVVAEVAARSAARGAGRSVLGWATFGVALVGDVALSTATTAAMGEHAEVMLRPWGAGMLLEAAEPMADPSARDCAALLLGRTMWADGEASEPERLLLAAHLGRDVRARGRTVPMASAAEVAVLARRAAAVADRAPAEVSRELDRCLDRSFVGIDARDRLSLIEWALAMAAADGRVDALERARHDRLVLALDGSRWLGDGAELEEPHLDLLERRVLSLLLVDERDPAFAEVRTAEVVARHDELAARTEAAVREAFGR